MLWIVCDRIIIFFCPVSATNLASAQLTKNMKTMNTIKKKMRYLKSNYLKLLLLRLLESCATAHSDIYIYLYFNCTYANQAFLTTIKYVYLIS